MLKCHLSVIHHLSVAQFQDIDLSNHNFDRVVGTDFCNVSAPECRQDLSIHTDLNNTFYSVFLQAQRQAFRVTKRSFSNLDRQKTKSCPDITSLVDREFEDPSNSNWQYTTVLDKVPPILPHPKTDQATQTALIHILHVNNTGTQYSSPSYSSDSSSSHYDGEIEGTENITVAKRYVRRQYSSHEDL